MLTQLDKHCGGDTNLPVDDPIDVVATPVVDPTPDHYPPGTPGNPG